MSINTPAVGRRGGASAERLITGLCALAFAAVVCFGAARFLAGLRDSFLLDYLPYVLSAVLGVAAVCVGGLKFIPRGVRISREGGARAPGFAKNIAWGAALCALGCVLVWIALAFAVEDEDLLVYFADMALGAAIAAAGGILFRLWVKRTAAGKAFLAFYHRHPMLPLLVPAALLIYFVYISLGWNLWVSVSDWEKGSLEATYGFGGFTQYAAMFGSEYFWPSLKNTLLLFCLIPICLALGLGLALLMDQGLRGSVLFRNLILLPFSLSFVVTGTVWAWMYRPTGGVLNSFLQVFGVDTQSLMWAASNDTVMLSIIIALVWQFSGYVAVIFLAGIKAVPENIINAAKLDGAYSARIYLKLIIPRLKGAMGSCITILAMYALRSFDFIVSLVGYTKTSAWTLPVWMYYETFQKNNFALGAAISCFLLALVLALILPLTVWSNRRK